jgi:hypothetical protein
VGIDTIHDGFFSRKRQRQGRDLRNIRGKKRAKGREVRRPFSAKARLKKSPSVAYSAAWQAFKYWQPDQ